MLHLAFASHYIHVMFFWGVPGTSGKYHCVFQPLVTHGNPFSDVIRLVKCVRCEIIVCLSRNDENSYQVFLSKWRLISVWNDPTDRSTLTLWNISRCEICNLYSLWNDWSSDNTNSRRVRHSIWRINVTWGKLLQETWRQPTAVHATSELLCKHMFHTMSNNSLENRGNIQMWMSPLLGDCMDGTGYL